MHSRLPCCNYPCGHDRLATMRNSGARFAASFANATIGMCQHEVPLFRAMQASLCSVANPPELAVEEYHGTRHQVRFTGTGTYARGAARCELSDLMVLVYDPMFREARLTYIQAKSERGVQANGGGVHGRALLANLEQWHLLATRPSISGVGYFNPPPDLLAGALLQSIGAFAFFVRDAGGECQVYYAAASMLPLAARYTTRTGRLVAQPDTLRCGPWPECLSSYGNREFGAALYGMLIGTPVWPQAAVSSTLPRWLATQLRGLATRRSESRGDLALELATLLDPSGRFDGVGEPQIGAGNLLILRTNLGLVRDRREEA